MLFVVSDLINRYSHRLTDKQFAVIFGKHSPLLS